jgi:hypothetical protein
MGVEELPEVERVVNAWSAFDEIEVGRLIVESMPEEYVCAIELPDLTETENSMLRDLVAYQSYHDQLRTRRLKRTEMLVIGFLGLAALCLRLYLEKITISAPYRVLDLSWQHI